MCGRRIGQLSDWQAGLLAKVKSWGLSPLAAKRNWVTGLWDIMPSLGVAARYGHDRRAIEKGTFIDSGF
jgi:hypothetical protein